MPSSITYVSLCNGCGATVHTVIPGGQKLPAQIYCPGCARLNAAKANYAAQQQAKRSQGWQKCVFCNGDFPAYQLDAKGVCNLCNNAIYNKTYGGTKVAYQRGRFQRPQTQAYPGAGGYTQQQAPQCSFTWDMPRMAYAVTCQYQPNFIEFIKAKIPVSDRAWDPTTKTWYIKDAWFEIMHELALQLWPGAVSVITREAAEKAWKEQEDARAAMLLAQRQAVLGPLESAMLEFCSICDIDALRKARNAMAIALHPDKGGDANVMAKLNASWFVVETELKKRNESK